MKFRTGTLLLAVLAAACSLLIFPVQAAQGAKNGIGYCLEVLIPSLYPFMVLSVFVVKSGLAHKVGGRLEGFTQNVFRLPGSAAPTILMSVIGGYPAGARSIAALYEDGEITQRQAERMLGFCVNAGPSFVITAVGAGFLKSPRAGAILFAAQVIVFLLLGVGCGLSAKRETPTHGKEETRETGVSQALILSAADAARAIISMCCFVILFAALMNLVRMFCTDPARSAAVSALLEVTGGCSDLARLGVPPWAVSAAIGWGGICVHFQVLSTLTELQFSKVRFVLFRLLQAFLSAAVSWGLMLLFPDTEEAFCNFAGPVSGALSSTPPASAALLVLCSALLLCIPRKKMEITSGK
ncbi:sporulation protein [Caproiciproducens sp. NJN-50]|uniref:sporulation protein n=1 Tax=Acutalibacteraceae TaxID=3082771 RepID=UPI000FFE2A6F|nr:MULTISPECIES: sporulation protein [Acutalibacteraceae]QAT50172.1 sporulation protein [Caproiciproducens sp. NJN-50]